MVVMRTPGRRNWEVRWVSWIGGMVAIAALSGSLWFAHGSWIRLHEPHNPHYDVTHCFDCHVSNGSKMSAEECFSCHDVNTRELLDGAVERRPALQEKPCFHPVKFGWVTKLCTSCHKEVTGFVAMIDIKTKSYVEIDMSSTHPIGMMPTAAIYPKTLPLSKKNGAINCATCHDPHGKDRRMKMLRYYYPGNGRPADFRALCLDCHTDDWLPLKVRPESIQRAKHHDKS